MELLLGCLYLQLVFDNMMQTIYILIILFVKMSSQALG